MVCPLAAQRYHWLVEALASPPQSCPCSTEDDYSAKPTSSLLRCHRNLHCSPSIVAGQKTIHMTPPMAALNSTTIFEAGGK